MSTLYLAFQFAGRYVENICFSSPEDGDGGHQGSQIGPGIGLQPVLPHARMDIASSAAWPIVFRSLYLTEYSFKEDNGLGGPRHWGNDPETVFRSLYPTGYSFQKGANAWETLFGWLI